MKRNNGHRYSHISSYEDLRREKEMLTLKGRIIEAKLLLTYQQFKQTFSPSNLIFSLIRKYILPEVSEFFGDLPGKNRNESDS